jgi:hypothetical protein
MSSTHQQPKPPGGFKRLLVISSVLAYVVFLGEQEDGWTCCTDSKQASTLGKCQHPQ